MGVALLTDQHHGKLLAIKPFDESGLYPIGSPAPLVVPGGLCLDSQGNVIITDSGNHCLVVRDLWSDSWQSYGTRGAGQGEFFCAVRRCRELEQRRLCRRCRQSTSRAHGCPGGQRMACVRDGGHAKRGGSCSRGKVC